MIDIFIYFNLMIFMSLMCLMSSLGLFYEDLSVMMEWTMVSINSMNMELMVLIDWISLLFISLVLMISAMIMIYSNIYMEGEVNIKRFIYLVNMFIFSMILMILSPNILSILFGWDGLGLVSYSLVIFYQNYSSYNSGMVTILCNRIGDVGLLMGISLMFMKGSWNMWGLEKGMWMVKLMLILAAITKSAQIPFSTWLPLAMAAPTPVSALVHSSTLVTAGVYLVIRFNKFLMSSGSGSSLFFLSVITMFMAGVMANLENDLKKIIALSTLSQLGLMMMILSLEFKMVAFYHLLVHAIFKSMLFMCAGIIIHLMLNSQDIRLYGNFNEVIPYTMMSFYIALMALCGFPFMAGFYSKDYIMELIYSNQISMLMLMMIIISLMLTVSYSLRLFYYTYFGSMKFYSYYEFKENKAMSFSMMILIILSIMMGSIMNWLFFLDLNLIFLDSKVKLLSLEICLLGIGGGVGMSMMEIYKKFYYFNYYGSSMWFMSYLYLWVYKPVNDWGEEIYGVDKMWIEFLGKDISKFMIKFYLRYKTYMIYQFLYLYILMFIMFILFY